MKIVRLAAAMIAAVLAAGLAPAAATPADLAPAEFTAVRLGDLSADFLDALVAHGAPAEARLSLTAPDAVVLTAEGGAPAIESVSYNRSSGRFLLRLRGADGGPLIAVAGVAAIPALLPTLSRDIARNDIVGEDDIAWTEVADLRADLFLTDADAIVGKAARRALPKGAPLRKADLQSPVLIKRGAVTTVILEGPGLRLTQQAVALASGAEGDVIAFRNLNSNREIKAVVVSATSARAPFRASFASVAALATGE